MLFWGGSEQQKYQNGDERFQEYWRNPYREKCPVFCRIYLIRIRITIAEAYFVIWGFEFFRLVSSTNLSLFRHIVLNHGENRSIKCSACPLFIMKTFAPWTESRIDVWKYPSNRFIFRHFHKVCLWPCTSWKITDEPRLIFSTPMYYKWMRVIFVSPYVPK